MTTKLIVLLGFVVAFSAGLLTGLNSRQETPSVPSQGSSGPTTTNSHRGGGRDRDRGFLSRELSLTPEQREQMNEIWSSVAARGGRDQDDVRRRYRNERDEAIADLIRTDDLRAYDTILREYQDKLAKLDQEFTAAWQAAVERTKSILTTDQRAKYEEILKRNQPGERGPRDRRGERSNSDDENRRAGERAASRPADK